MGLTPAQERVYRFVRDTLQQHGYSPSYEEIRQHLGFRSLNAVYKHLKQLEQRGLPPEPREQPETCPGTAASALRVVLPSLLGVVAAGTPIEAIEVPEVVDVPESLLGSGNNFALRVRGDSMIEEGIREGDILIITRQAHAESGQTVVALVRGEATVKKFYQHGEEIELRPANNQMNSLRISASDVEIVGTVVGLLRHYRKRKA